MTMKRNNTSSSDSTPKTKQLSSRDMCSNMKGRDNGKRV